MKKILQTFLVLACAALPAFAQAQSVSGKVTAAESGEPLPGVNVIVKGTGIGVVTDVNGSFKLDVPDASTAYLVFSYIGYRTQEVKVDRRSAITISLIADVQQLGEIVVTGQGTGIEKSRLTPSGKNTFVITGTCTPAPSASRQNPILEG